MSMFMNPQTRQSILGNNNNTLGLPNPVQIDPIGNLINSTNNFAPVNNGFNVTNSPQSNINWNNPATLTQYSGNGFNLNDHAFAVDPQSNSLFGRLRSGNTASYDSQGIMQNLMQDSNFKSFYAAQSPEWQQAYTQGVMSGTVNPNSDFNTQNLQVNSQLANIRNSTWTPQNTLSAVQTGVGIISSLGNLYSAYKQNKLANKQLKETNLLNRANFRNQAKAMNAQYRDQTSGRGVAVMTGQQKQDLAEHYKSRRVSETY